MPFDGTGFRAGPPRAERPGPSDNVMTAVIIVVFLLLMVTPISFAALADLVRFLQSR